MEKGRDKVSGKVLVVYYSRTGTTRRLAEEISGRLGADIEEVIDKRNRKGIIGWLSAGRDAGAKRLTEIAEPQRELGLYDLVLIGTPTWNGNISTPIRTYMTKYRESFHDVAIFCTGSVGDNRPLGDMEALIGKKPLASIKFMVKQEIETGGYIQKMNEFVERLKVPEGP